MQRDAGFEGHPLAAQFVELGLEGDVAQGLLDEPSAHSLEPFDEFPGYAAYDFLSVVCEDAQRRHETCGGHTSEEAVSLHEGRAGSAARSGDCRNESCRPPAAHDYVVVSGYGYLFL